MPPGRWDFSLVEFASTWLVIWWFVRGVARTAAARRPLLAQWISFLYARDRCGASALRRPPLHGARQCTQSGWRAFDFGIDAVSHGAEGLGCISTKSLFANVFRCE
jgi:hypothetical protein